MENKTAEDNREKPDFEFEAIAYANEWELSNWGDEKGKRLVDQSYRAGLKQADKIWNEYVTPLQSRIKELEKENESLIDDVLDSFTQACWIEKEKQYDHTCISTYEYMQHLLIEKGRIKKEDCYRD